MGRKPEPPPTGSPARRDASVFCELLLSKPEMIEEVGDERPRRPPAKEDWGWRET
jgi:hypothetical protein